MSNSSCTTIIVTPKASIDGRMRVAHSCDDALADHRIVFVAAQDWPEGAMRPVYPQGICSGALPRWNANIVPRLYVPGRSDEYSDSLGQAFPTLPVGEIPQVRHTYAYLDGNYGIINEAGLMLGECTCKAWNQCDPEEGKRLFYSAELGRVALERCTLAAEAVDLMGSLLEEFGYYGTGETLLVADANDAWVMEMTPSSDGTGGYWIAQRVPDGEIFVEANLFRIREVRPDSPDMKMCPYLSEEARKKPGLDWTEMASRGEYHHPYYSLRRVWRTMNILQPSVEYPTKVDGYLTKAYPFSFKPDRPVSREDIFRVYRDHLEGTQFDLTKCAAAGPWGNPNLARSTDDEEKAGAWERAISMTDTGYAYVLEPGVCWIAMGRPAEVPFVPLMVAPIPSEFSHGSAREFDPDRCAWWRFNLVSQASERCYREMIKEISRRQQMSEERAALLLESGKATPEVLSALAHATLDEWKELFAFLSVTFNQGYYTQGGVNQKLSSNPEFLEAVGFHKGPTKY